MIRFNVVLLTTRCNRGITILLGSLKTFFFHSNLHKFASILYTFGPLVLMQVLWYINHMCCMAETDALGTIQS